MKVNLKSITVDAIAAILGIIGAIIVLGDIADMALMAVALIKIAGFAFLYGSYCLLDVNHPEFGNEEV